MQRLLAYFSGALALIVVAAAAVSALTYAAQRCWACLAAVGFGLHLREVEDQAIRAALQADPESAAKDVDPAWSPDTEKCLRYAKEVFSGPFVMPDLANPIAQ